MANRHIKKCSAPLLIRKMLMKTTMRCHVTHFTIATIKRTDLIKFWQENGAVRTPHTLQNGIQMIQPLWKTG